MRLVQSGSDTLVQIDQDGPGTEANFTTYFILSNVAASSLTAFNFSGYPPDGSLPAGATINGTSGDDPYPILSGTIGGDIIHGLGGSDHLDGGDGNDSLYGDEGNDVLDGGLASDLLDGEPGDDALGDSYGVNAFYGGDGNDSILSFSSSPGQLVDGGPGDDSIRLSSPQSTVVGGSGSDTITIVSSDNSIAGGADADTFAINTSSHGNVITDFAPGAGGDIFLPMPIVASSRGVDVLSLFANGGMRLVQSGADTLVQFRAIASINEATYIFGGFETAAILKNVIATSLAAYNFGGAQPYVHSARQAHPADDFNGDGRSDLLWMSDGGNVREWLGQANGAFSGNLANFNAVIDSAVWHVAATGDFNGDGHADLLWRSGDGTTTEWLAKSNGSFNPTAGYSAVPLDWKVVGTGDFNSDGRIDVLWRSNAGEVREWLGQASGGFAGNVANFDVTVDPVIWHVAGTGDFNDDGRTDMLWESGDGTITQWIAQANGSFVPTSINQQLYGGWHVEAIGDFDGDGIDDLLLRNVDGKVRDWLGVHSGYYIDNGLVLFQDVDSIWHVTAVGDYNGDGIDDIAWRSDDGTTTDWLGRADGSYQENSANLMTAVPHDWHLQGSLVHDLPF